MKAFPLALIAHAALVIGCGGAPPPASPSDGTTATTEHTVAWPQLGAGPDRYIGIAFGPDSYQECRRISPKFPFDSATAQAQDREQIAAFARCMNDPTMKERTVLLVGRADPRGGDDYNAELGRKRAKTIKDILVENGISEGRIEVASDGAKGTLGDEASYGYDRRVDVVVKGGVHKP
jgi:outer membrane protein OmpA-like peptidoglycan-associated protein